MRTRRLCAVAAMAATAFALSTGSALAETAQPTAAFAGHLVAGPGATTVKISYTCTSSPGSVSHLYIGIKQGPGINMEEGRTGSNYADTFYSTNWKSDSGPNALTCDGTQHTQTAVLKPQPGFDAAVPRLHSGPAFVQLCVFDNVTEFSDDGEPLNGGFGFDYSMHDVQAGNGQG